MKTLQMFFQCWLEIANKQSRYRDKWLSDQTYYRAMKAQFPSLMEVGFTRAKLNHAISKAGGATFDDFSSESNKTGIF